MARLQVNDRVSYWSESYKQWVECIVQSVRADGAVEVSCKPGHWMTLQEQQHKLNTVQPSAASSAPPCAGYGDGYPRRGTITTDSKGVSSAPTIKQMQVIRSVLDSKEETRKRALVEFRRFDADRDKLLQEDELQVCLETLTKELGIPSIPKFDEDGHPIFSTQLQMLIRKFDSDGNGALDLDEFTEFFRRLLIRSRQSFEEFKVHSAFFVDKQSGSPFDVYKVKKQLGEGAFGITHLVEQQSSGQTRVLKTINKKKANMPPEELEQEINGLRSLDHPHIIKLFEYYEDDLNIYLAMEAAQGGELLKVIQDLSKEGWRVSERWSATVMQQVLEGIAYCHAKKLMHKDIKAENIMLLRSRESKTHPHAVIIDLGLAEMFSAASASKGFYSFVPNGPDRGAHHDDLYKRRELRSQKVGGTPTTMAPEVWRTYMGKGSFGMKCDVYSLGVVLFQLLTGELPFVVTVVDPMQWLDKIKQGPNKELLNGCSEESKTLVCEMLAFDDRERPTARKALMSTWLTNNAQQVDVALSETQMTALFNFDKRNELQKAVTLQVASQLRAADLPKINAIFRKYDVDNTGSLEPDELERALCDMGCDQETAKKAAKAIDLDKNGLVEYTEFVAACISIFDDRHEAYLWDIFSKMDKEGRGALCHKEMENLLIDGRWLGMGFTPSRTEVLKYIEDMDVDQDGLIRFDEFVNYLSPHHTITLAAKPSESTLPPPRE